MDKPKFSIILPVYNQNDHVRRIFSDYTKKLPNINTSWELLFVVNGSKDGSFKTLESLAAGFPNIRVFNLTQGGWGRAVKFGLKESRGTFRCYTNSARTPIEDLVTILKYASTDDQIVLKATRVMRESFVRKIGSILYNYENRLLLHTPLWDVNGTPKVLPETVLARIDIDGLPNDDLLDAELMARIWRTKTQIVEILIISPKRIGGKSTTNFRSAFRMYAGLVWLWYKLSKSHAPSPKPQ